MIEIGKKQKLIVAKTVDFGVYLAEDKNAGQEDRVLLPAKQVPEGTREGDALDVFIYKDSRDRLIATTREPLLQVGQTASGNQDRCIPGLGLRERPAPSIP